MKRSLAINNHDYTYIYFLREIIENAIAMKHQKLCGAEQVHLTELLVMKDNELKETLKLAAEQAKVNQKMDLLRAEVDKLDQDIQQLQRQLKEAEQILVIEHFHFFFFTLCLYIAIIFD